MNLKAKVIESIKWLFLAQLLSQLVRILVTIVVIRSLASEEMAYVALAQSITSFFEIFSTLGLNAAIISKKDIHKRDLQNIFGLVLLINGTLGVLLLLFSQRLAEFYAMPALAAILNVSAVSFLLIALKFIPNAMMTREMRFKEISIVQLLAGIGGALTSYICVVYGLGYWALVYGGIAFQLISAVLQIAASRNFVSPRLALAESIHHISFGSYVMGCTLVWYLLVTLDVVIAGKFWTAETLGIYAVAVQVTAMPINRILPLLKSVALPAFSKSYASDAAKLESYVIKSSTLAAVLSVPLFWGMAATTSLFVPLVLGANWTAAILPLAFLCIAAPFRFFIELLTPAVMARGDPRTIFINSAVMAALMIVAYFVVAANYSSPALLAGVWMVLYPLLVLYATGRYCEVMGMSSAAILKPVARVLGSGLLMLVVVAVYAVELAGAFNPWLHLASAIMLGAFVYFAGLVMFDRKRVGEILAIARGGKPRV